MGQKNQIYCKWLRFLPSPDNPREFYLVIEKDKPLSKQTIQDFEERFQGKDVIITITKLVRKKEKEEIVEEFEEWV